MKKVLINNKRTFVALICIVLLAFGIYHLMVGKPIPCHELIISFEMEPESKQVLVNMETINGRPITRVRIKTEKRGDQNVAVLQAYTPYLFLSTHYSKRVSLENWTRVEVDSQNDENYIIWTPVSDMPELIYFQNGEEIARRTLCTSVDRNLVYNLLVTEGKTLEESKLAPSDAEEYIKISDSGNDFYLIEINGQHFLLYPENASAVINNAAVPIPKEEYISIKELVGLPD